MAYADSGMSRIGYAAGNSVFLYKTADAIATVIASGYFNSKYAELALGDVILCVSSNGGTIAVDLLVVSSATAATTVTTTNGT
jgi:hypothetical protein